MSIERIAEEGFNINISRYINNTVGDEEVDLAVTHEELISLEQRILKAKSKHNEFLKELGLATLPGS